MKIKQEHYEVLQTAVEEVLANIKNYKPDLNLLESYRKEGLSDMRYRWDLLHATELRIGDSIGCPNCDLPLYDYMDDNNIDTALRKITGTK
jgi:hypothetical protein